MDRAVGRLATDLGIPRVGASATQLADSAKDTNAHAAYG